MNKRWVIKKAARGAVTFGSLASGALALRGALARGPRVRGLTYHRVGDDAPQDPFCVTRSAFDAQMRLLAEEGRAVSLEQVQRFVAGREDLPDGACLVTIDDGCLSTLTEVLQGERGPHRGELPLCLERLVHALLRELQRERRLRRDVDVKGVQRRQGRQHLL